MRATNKRMLQFLWLKVNIRTYGATFLLELRYLRLLSRNNGFNAGAPVRFIIHGWNNNQASDVN